MGLVEDRYLEPDDNCEAITNCDRCGNEILYSDVVYKVDDELLCEDCWCDYEQECRQEGDRELEYLSSDDDNDEYEYEGEFYD